MEVEIVSEKELRKEYKKLSKDELIDILVNQNIFLTFIGDDENKYCVRYL